MAEHPGNGNGNGDGDGATDDVTEEVPALEQTDLVDDGDDAGDDELGPAPRDPSPSDEQPVVVFGVEDSDDDAPALRGNDDEVLPEPDLPSRGGDGLAEAYSGLEIRTPPEELDAFARGRVDALARLGQVDRAAMAAEALQMAQAALRRVMGSQPREAP